VTSRTFVFDPKDPDWIYEPCDTMLQWLMQTVAVHCRYTGRPVRVRIYVSGTR